MMTKPDLLYPKPRDRRDVWNAELFHGCDYVGKYEMPMLTACDCVPPSVTAFSDASEEKADGSFLHFYEADYKFEQIWRNPKRYLPLIKAYGGAIAPDFSIYREMPLSLQIYNTFRSRAVGYWWSRNGVKVIPNASWGDKRSYEFCFSGIPKNSTIAIGTHGCVKRISDRRYFLDAFLKMLDSLTPKRIIVYGSASDKIIPPLFVSDIEIVCFESKFSLTHKRKAV
jgi:hypothetical protein